ncbi:hypothetical protein FQR65_LT03852 [Abscondita terminalis]|nr:hypothetical protein FQR65_LT03852 [Abscondita terminalis]
MPLPFDSQKTDSQPQCQSQSQSQEVQKIIYGQLVSMRPYLRSVALDKPEFTLGRAVDCDVVLNQNNLSRNYVTTVSFVHFKITHLANESRVFITDLSKNGTYINSRLIGRGNENVVQDGDLISIATPGYNVFRFKNGNCPVVQYFLPPKLTMKYEFEKPLGTGACGEVVLVYDRISRKPFAIKKINKAKISDPTNLNNPERIESEVNIMLALTHPNIISTEEVVDTKEAVFIVLEYMDGGELTDLLSETALPEDVAKLLFYQIALGLRHLHLRNITHRDLKPGNILLQSKNQTTIAKIADFGLSKMIFTNVQLVTCCGSPCYIAPEVIDSRCGSYTKQVDIWSLGVILFHMLSGELPFKLKSNRLADLLRLIVHGTYTMSSTVWNSISSDAKDLIRNMLIKNPERRYNIDEVVNHPWLAKDLAMQQQVGDMQIKNTNLLQQCCDDPPHKKLKID